MSRRLIGENCPNSDDFDKIPIFGLKKHSKYRILFNNNEFEFTMFSKNICSEHFCSLKWYNRFTINTLTIVRFSTYPTFIPTASLWRLKNNKTNNFQIQTLKLNHWSNTPFSMALFPWKLKCFYTQLKDLQEKKKTNKQKLYHNQWTLQWDMNKSCMKFGWKKIITWNYCDCLQTMVL